MTTSREYRATIRREDIKIPPKTTASFSQHTSQHNLTTSPPNPSHLPLPKPQMIPANYHQHASAPSLQQHQPPPHIHPREPSEEKATTATPPPKKNKRDERGQNLLENPRSSSKNAPNVSSPDLTPPSGQYATACLPTARPIIGGTSDSSRNSIFDPPSASVAAAVAVPVVVVVGTTVAVVAEVTVTGVVVLLWCWICWCMLCAAKWPWCMAAPQRLMPDQRARSPTARWEEELGVEGGKVRLVGERG